MVLNSEEYGLPEDVRISVAVRDYVSPKGKRLEGNGVRPDVEIAPTAEDVSASRDAVLAKALTLFK